MLVLLTSVIGTLAYGAEAVTAGVVGLSWETLLTIYGPMAGMLVWFMHREKIRDMKEEHRDKAFCGLIVQCTEALTRMNSTLAEFRADLEKHRAAVYRLCDESRGNARIFERSE